MDYLADLPNMICSILELTTTRTAGRLRVVPLFLNARSKRRGDDERGWERTERRKEDFDRMGEDF